MKNIAPTAKSPLSIAVIGAGKIGSTFAYRLARAGHDVTVIARPDSPRLQQLQRDQGIILKTGERAEVRVADKLDEEAAYNLVVVTTPAHQVDAVLPALQRSKAQCVQFMFVTFEPERLRDAIGSHRCSFGMPAVMATVDSEGRIKPTIISSLKPLHGDQRWAELFSRAGIPSAFEPEMALWLRCEAPPDRRHRKHSGGGATKRRRRHMGGGESRRPRVARRLRNRQGTGVSPVPVYQVHDVLCSQLPDRLAAMGFIPHPRNA